MKNWMGLQSKRMAFISNFALSFSGETLVNLLIFSWWSSLWFHFSFQLESCVNHSLWSTNLDLGLSWESQKKSLHSVKNTLFKGKWHHPTGSGHRGNKKERERSWAWDFFSLSLCFRTTASVTPALLLLLWWHPTPAPDILLPRIVNQSKFLLKIHSSVI